MEQTIYPVGFFRDKARHLKELPEVLDAKFGGVLLAGRACKATQAMGGACLLRAIAAVVFGGTSILGGRGSYLGTVGLCS